MCSAVARLDAAAALPGPHAHVTNHSPRPVNRVVTDRSAIAAPSRRAAQGGRGGCRVAQVCHNGRRTLAQAVGAGRGASGTFCRVHGTRAALSVAGAASGWAPRGRPLCSAFRCDLAAARSTPSGASAAPERIRAGRGRPGGGPRSRWGRTERWISVSCTVMGFRTCALVYRAMYKKNRDCARFMYGIGDRL